MIFVFEKGTNKFIGMAPAVVDSGKLREYELGELYPNADPEKVGYFYLKDSPKFAMDPNTWQWTLGKKGVPIGIEYKPMLALALSTNCPDRDGDGRPEITLRRATSGTMGVSGMLLRNNPEEYAEIRVQIMDGIKTSGTVADIRLSATGGILESRILSTNGSGFVMTTLHPAFTTNEITVTARAEGMREAKITFEVFLDTDITRMNFGGPKIPNK
jgi:hypothetical protein